MFIFAWCFSTLWAVRSRLGGRLKGMATHRPSPYRRRRHCRKCGEVVLLSSADRLCPGHVWEASRRGTFMRPGYLYFEGSDADMRWMESRLWAFSMGTEHTTRWVKYEVMYDEADVPFGARIYGDAQRSFDTVEPPPQPEWFATVRRNAKGQWLFKIEENDRQGFLDALLGKG